MANARTPSRPTNGNSNTAPEFSFAPDAMSRGVLSFHELNNRHRFAFLLRTLDQHFPYFVPMLRRFFIGVAVRHRLHHAAYPFGQCDQKSIVLVRPGDLHRIMGICLRHVRPPRAFLLLLFQRFFRFSDGFLRRFFLIGFGIISIPTRNRYRFRHIGMIPGGMTAPCAIQTISSFLKVLA